MIENSYCPVVDGDCIMEKCKSYAIEEIKTYDASWWHTVKTLKTHIRWGVCCFTGRIPTKEILVETQQ